MNLKYLSTVELPPVSDTRVMMMPFHTHDIVGTIPMRNFMDWKDVLYAMCREAPPGVGYLTIDEALVKKGETHRRPGLHVDGLGGWGPVGSWGAGGFTMVSSHIGCRVWDQTIEGTPGEDGDCSHLANALKPSKAYYLEPNTVYWVAPLTVHESIPMAQDTFRQFCRVSYPSDAPWYEGYTENPLGIKPSGKILPARTKQMGYRA